MSIAIFEDFIEKEDKLATNASSTGSSVRIDGSGGLVEIKTGTTSGNWRQIETLKKYVEAKHNPVFGALLKTNQAADQEIFIGLADSAPGYSANNAIGFYRSDGGSVGYWKARVKSGGTGTDVDLGILGDSTREVELLCIVSPIQVLFFLDGKLVGQVQSNIPTASLYFVLAIKTGTNAEHKMTVDYAHLAAGR